MGLTVSAEEIRALDGKIRELNTDVLAHPMPPTPPGSVIAPFAAFRAQWTAFFFNWLAWEADHRSFLSQTGDDAATEFEGFQGGYNEQRRRFLEDFSGETGAAPSNSGGPLDDLAHGAGDFADTVLKVALVVGVAYVVAQAVKR